MQKIVRKHVLQLSGYILILLEKNYGDVDNNILPLMDDNKTIM